MVGRGWAGRLLADDVRLCQQTLQDRSELPNGQIVDHVFQDCSQIAEASCRGAVVEFARIDRDPRAAIRRDRF